MRKKILKVKKVQDIPFGSLYITLKLSVSDFR